MPRRRPTIRVIDADVLTRTIGHCTFRDALEAVEGGDAEFVTRDSHGLPFRVSAMFVRTTPHIGTEIMLRVVNDHPLRRLIRYDRDEEGWTLSIAGASEAVNRAWHESLPQR